MNNIQNLTTIMGNTSNDRFNSIAKENMPLTKNNSFLRYSNSLNSDRYARLRTMAQQKNAHNQNTKLSYFMRTFGQSYYYEKFKQYQKILYLILEEPSSSHIGRFLFFIIICGIGFTSLHAIIISTYSDQQPDNPIANALEIIISILFVVEYVLRLCSATAFGERILNFLKKPIMIIDLISIIPFLFDEFLSLENLNSLKIMRMMRLIKIFRVLKFTRYMKGTSLFWDGIKSSITSFGFLLLSLIIGNIMFAVAYYYSEYNPVAIDDGDTSVVVSIPDAMWWALATMTTIGYGDKYPHTYLGKIISGTTALTGMFMIALPVAILGVNFQKVYDTNIEYHKIKGLKKNILKHHPNQTEDQIEITFMNERIKKIAKGSAMIKELLTKSEELYKIVENEIKSLYSALYEEERRESELKANEINLFGMNGKIKIMERLQRAKKKIKLMQLFHKPQDFEDSLKSKLLNQDNELDSKYDIDANMDKYSNITEVQVNTKISKIKEEDEKEPLSPLSPGGKEMKKLVTKHTIVLQKCLEDEADIIPPISDDEPVSRLPKDQNFIIDHKKRTIFNKERGRKIRKHKSKQPKIFIKSNSEEHENSFIKYKNENLEFLSTNMLNELILIDSETENIQKENGKTKNNNFTFLGINKNMGSSKKTLSHILEPDTPSNAESNSNNSNINNQKTTGSPERYRLIPVRDGYHINTNSNTWKLAEKIFEAKFRKTFLQKQRKNPVNPFPIPGAFSLLKPSVKPIQRNISFSQNLDRSESSDLLEKSVFNIDGPKYSKTQLKLNKCKILEEREDFMPSIDDSILDHGTHDITDFPRDNDNKYTSLNDTTTLQGRYIKPFKQNKPQPKSNIFNKLRQK